MATPNITPTAPYLAEQVTYVKIKDAQDKVKVYPESEDLDKQIEAGEVTEIARQTFTFYTPQTLEGAQELISDEEEFVNLVTRGLTTKLQNKARTTVLKDDFEAVEGVIDLKEACNAKTERRGLSPMEKTLRSVQDLPEAQRQQLLAILSAMNSSQQVEEEEVVEA